MAWYDDDKQRFEQDFPVGLSNDDNMLVTVNVSTGQVTILWTREVLEKFIADVTATLEAKKWPVERTDN
jgi:hypothetical protein